jgi:hypothetical protein
MKRAPRKDKKVAHLTVRGICEPRRLAMRAPRALSPQRAILAKIQDLSPEKVAEVEDFIDFLRQQGDRQLTRAATKLAESAFEKVWDNPEDAAYDQL